MNKELNKDELRVRCEELEQQLSIAEHTITRLQNELKKEIRKNDRINR